MSEAGPTGDQEFQHPGAFIKENILKPRGLTVTEAAKSIGVARPNLSKFLNGKVSTTTEMASRIELAFGISANIIWTRPLKLESTFC